VKRGNELEVAQVGWDKRGYYYQVRKVKGRVVRRYFGKGLVAELAADYDALNRKYREGCQADAAALRDEFAELDALIQPLAELADLVATVALVSAGFHRHNRGEWRKKRGKRSD
jgi:hypothetical protein